VKEARHSAPDHRDRIAGPAPGEALTAMRTASASCGRTPAWSITSRKVAAVTTKPGGTGIGLTLSRQIAEAHGGSLSLQNKAEGGGCLATLRLPLA